MNPSWHAVDEEITRLEDSQLACVQWNGARLITAGLMLVVLTSAYMSDISAAPDSPPRVVRARQFVLADADTKPRAKLQLSSKEDLAQIAFSDGKGSPRLFLGVAEKDGAFIHIMDAKRTQTVSLAAYDKMSTLAIQGEGQRSLHLECSDERCILGLCDSKETRFRVAASVTTKGDKKGSWFYVRDADHEPVFQAP